MKNSYIILLFLFLTLMSCSKAEIRQAQVITQEEIDEYNRNHGGAAEPEPEMPEDEPIIPEDPSDEERIEDGSVYFIRTVAAGAKDGSSWGNAMGPDELRQLIAQKMKDGKQDNEQAHMQAGNLDGVRLYFGPGNFLLADASTKRVKLEWTNYSKQVSLYFYGGYSEASSGIDRSQRDIVENETIFVGDANYNNVAESADSKIFVLGNQTDIHFDGITFAYAYAGEGNGAALTLSAGATGDCSATLNDCSFRSNVSLGSAILVQKGSLKATGCTFKNNTSAIGGALDMANVRSVVSLYNCMFVDNQATNTGGALRLEQGRLYLRDCHFKDNLSNSRGVLRLNNGLCYMDRVSIYGSYVSQEWGLAIHCTNLGALCMNNVTVGGSSGKLSENPSINGTADYLIVNSTLADNGTMSSLRIEGGRQTVLLNSILVNSSSDKPAVLFSGNATVRSLGNCIVGTVSGSDGSTKIYSPGAGDKENASYADLGLSWDSEKNIFKWNGSLSGHTPIDGATIGNKVKTSLDVSLSGVQDGNEVFKIQNVGEDYYNWVTESDPDGFSIDASGNPRGASATCGAWEKI